MFELLVNIVSLNTFSSVNKMLEVVEKDWVAEDHISVQWPRYSVPVSQLHTPGSPFFLFDHVEKLVILTLEVLNVLHE